MSWSETMYEIQHFYNAFDLDNRVTKVENKFPIVAKKDSDLKPKGISVENQSVGSIWFIEEDN
jgi:hypothetical protein